VPLGPQEGRRQLGRENQREGSQRRGYGFGTGVAERKPPSSAGREGRKKENCRKVRGRSLEGAKRRERNTWELGKAVLTKERYRHGGESKARISMEKLLKSERGGAWQRTGKMCVTTKEEKLLRKTRGIKEKGMLNARLDAHKTGAKGKKEKSLVCKKGGEGSKGNWWQ